MAMKKVSQIKMMPTLEDIKKRKEPKSKEKENIYECSEDTLDYTLGQGP